MELSDVTQVVDLTNAEAANRYFAAGWKYLSQYTTAYDTQPPGCHHMTQHYVLAWYGANPKHPEHHEPPAPQESGPIDW